MSGCGGLRFAFTSFQMLNSIINDMSSVFVGIRIVQEEAYNCLTCKVQLSYVRFVDVAA